jgi:uncharacterized damage-inducible protein DinB
MQRDFVRPKEAIPMDEPEPQFPGKAALLDEIAAERTALDRVVAGLSADQLAAPVLDGARAVKDVLAHLLYWEGHMIRNVRAAQGESVPPVPFHDVADEDERNALVFAHSQEQAPAAVLAESQAQWATTRAVLEALPEPAWLQPRPGADYALWGHIAANTNEHYREHRAQIEQALAAGLL